MEMWVDSQAFLDALTDKEVHGAELERHLKQIERKTFTLGPSDTHQVFFDVGEVDSVLVRTAETGSGIIVKRELRVWGPS